MDQRVIIAQLNIEHLRRKLIEVEATQQTIIRLLEEQQAKLAALNETPDNTPSRLTDKNVEYRQEADRAQVSANNSQTNGDRAAWLRIAQSWLGLVPRHPQTAQENFDAKAMSKGTGQEDSDSSH